MQKVTEKKTRERRTLENELREFSRGIEMMRKGKQKEEQGKSARKQGRKRGRDAMCCTPEPGEKEGELGLGI